MPHPKSHIHLKSTQNVTHDDPLFGLKGDCVRIPYQISLSNVDTAVDYGVSEDLGLLC